MNLLREYLDAGAPATPGSYPVPTFDAGMKDPAYIVNAFYDLNRVYNERFVLVNVLAARLTALETAVSSGSINAFASRRFLQVGVADQFDILVQLSALNAIGTTGPALLAAVTAEWLTPVQTALTSFNTTYQTPLRAKGLI